MDMLNSVSPLESGWMDLRVDAPILEDALVYHTESSESNRWIGSVMGLIDEKTVVPLLVMSDENHVEVIPMIQDGKKMAHRVSYWKPWPKASFPIPSGF